MKASTVTSDETPLARPKYYEMDGALRANANRAWLLAFLTIPIALLAIGFAIFVRLQPPTVIRIGPNGDVSTPGKAAKGAVTDLATGGTDEFLDQSFVKRFLTSYLNYSPADVDDHWANSLNMMTRNLRAYTLKALGDDDTRGKIDEGQIQSVFHLREIDAVSGEPLTYLVYGVKDVHHHIERHRDNRSFRQRISRAPHRRQAFGCESRRTLDCGLQRTPDRRRAPRPHPECPRCCSGERRRSK